MPAIQQAIRNTAKHAPIGAYSRSRGLKEGRWLESNSLAASSATLLLVLQLLLVSELESTEELASSGSSSSEVALLATFADPLRRSDTTVLTSFGRCKHTHGDLRNGFLAIAVQEPGPTLDRRGPAMLV